VFIYSYLDIVIRELRFTIIKLKKSVNLFINLQKRELSRLDSMSRQTLLKFYHKGR